MEFGVLQVLLSHKQDVRIVRPYPNGSLLTGSRDLTAKLYQSDESDGDILKTFNGHENQIYDICIVREPIEPNVEPPKNRPYKFVTVSEDGTARVWDKDIGCVQTIPIKASTLWSVAGLDNGNFVVGTSDGHAYVYTNKIDQAST